MQYAVEQFVSKIKVPIVCIFDGNTMYFIDGTELAAYWFDKRYSIEFISVDKGKVVIQLKEQIVPGLNSVGDEQVAGSEWIKDYIERFGSEPNLFDGA